MKGFLERTMLKIEVENFKIFYFNFLYIIMFFYENVEKI